MRQKIIIITLIAFGVGICAGVGIIFGYRWYLATSSSETISNTANTTTYEKNSRVSAEPSAAEEWKSAEKEQERIAATNGLVQRIDEDNLVLKLTDGSEITLTNANKCGGDGTELEITKCYGYFFGRHFEKVHGYFVYIGYYESRAYKWIDDRTGEITDILDIPHFSPSGNRFVAARGIEEEGDGVQIWDLTSGKLVKEWEYIAKEYAVYSFVDWEDEDTVNLSVFTYPPRDEKNPGIRHPITLPIKLLRLPEWHIEGLPSSPKNGE